ncbi:MAG TPA: hypothetical protein VK002_13710 [Rubricoccaceae bacterium]|jgi:hypothetical protein|nr:hypothetical protein [Rubricoccaceae bacterium]
MAIELPPEFSAFLSSLHEHRVEYLLVGGYAVGYHGYPRVTGDIDVWVRPSPENAQRVVAAIRHFGFDVPELRVESLTRANQIVRMGLPPKRIELMTSASGVDFEACWADRIEDEWDGVPVHIISLEHLKQNKRASGRLKDLADLDYLP